MKFKHIGKHIGKDNGKAQDDKGKEQSSLTRRNFLRNGSSAGVGIGLIVTSKTALGQNATKDGSAAIGFGLLQYYVDEVEPFKINQQSIPNQIVLLSVSFCLYWQP